jgi:hypothetical protein
MIWKIMMLVLIKMLKLKKSMLKVNNLPIYIVDLLELWVLTQL